MKEILDEQSLLLSTKLDRVQAKLSRSNSDEYVKSLWNIIGLIQKNMAIEVSSEQIDPTMNDLLKDSNMNKIQDPDKSMAGSLAVPRTPKELSDFNNSKKLLETTIINIREKITQIHRQCVLPSTKFPYVINSANLLLSLSKLLTVL